MITNDGLSALGSLVNLMHPDLTFCDTLSR
jgi:hypothetical protein